MSRRRSMDETPDQLKQRRLLARKSYQTSESWTAQEDEIVLQHGPKVAAQKLPNRSRQAVAQRRWKLRNRHETTSFALLWSKQEVAILRKHYPTEPMKKMLERLPNRNRWQITNKACSLKIRRLYRGMHCSADVEGHFELIDQIRERLRTDQISIRKFQKETGTGTYFYNFRSRKTVNLRYIIKAMDFFEAKLVIDWNDR